MSRAHEAERGDGIRSLGMKNEMGREGSWDVQLRRSEMKRRLSGALLSAPSLCAKLLAGES